MHDSAGAPAPISVELFGGPAVRHGGHPLKLTAQQRAFVTLVCGYGSQGIDRPRLGWLLWEADDAPDLRQRVRQLLHRTTDRVGGPMVLTEGDLLRPASDGVESDLSRFEGLLRRGSLAEAAGLLARGFAPRLTSCPTGSFEDWLSAKRLSLLEDLRRVASRRWDETSEAGLWGDARDAAEALYMHFPADLAVVAKVIESRARTGSLASAEAVFGAYAERSPASPAPPELTELMHRVGRLRRDRPVQLSRNDPVAPLVGRTEEIATARRVFDDVREGEFRFVLLTGEGGIGKTRVLDELKKESVLAGFRPLHARASEAERHIPLNPFGDALKTLDFAAHLRAIGAPWRSVIASLLPVDDEEPIEAVPPIQEARLSRRLMDALFLLMRRIAGEEPTLLFIDDLQWADDTTLTALQFIQRRWEHGPFGIIAAARPGLLEKSGPGRDYLAPKDGLSVTRVHVRELRRDEGHRLVTHLIGADVAPTVVHRLCELAGLHPLYLTELAKDFAAGRLTLPERPADEVAIPVSLHEIFRSRMQLLSSTSVKVAGLLAVRGKPMRLTDVAALTGLPVERCADCAEELLELRLVALHQDTLRVAHELFRSALYRHLSEARRAVLHRAIAEHLSARPDDGTHGELAIHFARAGERDPAVRHAWAAATNAVEHGALAEAAYFFELVVDNETDPTRVAEATAELARALHLSRAIGRANPLLELAAVRLRQIGNHTRALRMDIRRVEGLSEAGASAIGDLLNRLAAIKQEAETLGDWEAVALALDAELHLRHTAADLPGVGLVFAEMRRVAQQGSMVAGAVANSGLALEVLFGNEEEALARARQAVERCDPQSDHRLKVLLRLLLVLQYQGVVHTEECASVVSEARRLAKKTGDLVLRFSLENNLAVWHLDSGDLDAADVLMARSSELLGSGKLDLNRFNHAVNAGELALARGDYAKARSYFLDAEGYIGAKTPAFAMDLVHSGLGLSALALGDLKEARQREESLSPSPPRWYFDPSLILGFRSRMHETRGDHAAAAGILEDGAAAVEGRLVLAWLKLLQGHARVLRKISPERARDVAERGLQKSLSLNLGHRVAEFERIVKAIGAQ